MSHAKNKVDWCLEKAEEEMKEGNEHRGLIKVNPDTKEAQRHIEKAEHYLQATNLLKKENFSDISASTLFYSMYHCLLAIAAKFGYESANQECTFALMYNLIEDNKIDLDKGFLEEISSLDVKNTDSKTVVKIREKYQYGTELSIEDDIYNALLRKAKELILKTKKIIEE